MWFRVFIYASSLCSMLTATVTACWAFELCQNMGDLRAVLCLHESFVDTDGAVKMLKCCSCCSSRVGVKVEHTGFGQARLGELTTTPRLWHSTVLVHCKVLCCTFVCWNSNLTKSTSFPKHISQRYVMLEEWFPHISAKNLVCIGVDELQLGQTC